MFPYSGAISTALSYNDPGRIFTGGPPVARRGDRGVVLLQYQLPSTVSWPLQKTSSEAGFRGWLYGESMVARKSSLDVSSDPNE